MTATGSSLTAPVRSDGLWERLRKLGLFAIILLNAQIFLGTTANPLGIDGVQEVFYIFLAGWSVISLFEQQRVAGRVFRTDLFVLTAVLALMLYSAVAANVVYGQPIRFGLLEERRILAVLIYFPIASMLRNRWISIFELESMLLSTAVICSLLSIGVSSGVIPAIQQTASSELSLRGERITVGASFVAMAIPLLLANRMIEPRPFDIPVLLFLLFTLLFVMQTRQLILAAAIASVFVVRGPRLPLILTGLVFVAYAVILVIPGMVERVETTLLLFQDLTSDAYLTRSWRAMSYSAALSAIGSGEILGHGALSAQWWGGFSRVIGPFFFIADIGVAGTVFRYGLLGILIYGLYFAIQFKVLRSIPADRSRKFYGAAILFVMVAMPVGAPLEYRGYIVGLILAATHFLAYSSPARVRA